MVTSIRGVLGAALLVATCHADVVSMDARGFALKPEGEGTKVTVDYLVSAYSPDVDDKQLAAAIDGAITGQVRGSEST